MKKLIPCTAKLLTGNIIEMSTIRIIVPTKSNYSTKIEATFKIDTFKLYKLEKGPKNTVTLSDKDALKFYEQMKISRKLELAAADLYKDKVIRGFCHLYNGQEAVAVGMRSAMRDKDSLITSYRCHVWTYLMGISLVGVLAELTGRKSGCSRGKGGSMHMYSRNFYGGNGIVGAQVPLATGIALAHQYKGDGGICFGLYGDGAANQGQLFESYNIAKLRKLPVIYVCENNGYGMGTAAHRHAACPEFYKRGNYIPGILVDGMDVLATREVTRFAIDYCLSGKGPLIIEMDTYRYMGHSMSDPGTSYRSREEIQEVRNKWDPIATFKERILSSSLVTEDHLKEIDTKVRQEIEVVVKQSSTDPEVGIEELAADIYYKNLEPIIRRTHPGSPLKHIEVAPRK